MLKVSFLTNCQHAVIIQSLGIDFKNLMKKMKVILIMILGQFDNIFTPADAI